jgi:hypothetical protein
MDMAARKIKKIYRSELTDEGAGVQVKRAFGNNDVPLYDPFLLLDDLRNDNPAQYLKGFPWHPHRGIEIITYVLRGEINHSDSLGHKGIISAGDVLHMTAGSGVVHQEMPKGNAEGAMYAFQLWVNLPAAYKMGHPRYREIKSADIPQVTMDYGIRAKVISGTLQGVSGPLKNLTCDLEYLDIIVPAKSDYVHRTKPGYKTFAYVIRGSCIFSYEKEYYALDETVVLFDEGDDIHVQTEEKPVRFLLFSGNPVGEPIAWSGPIVMNTSKEVDSALKEYQNGTFIKSK